MNKGILHRLILILAPMPAKGEEKEAIGAAIDLNLAPMLDGEGPGGLY